MTQRQAFLSRLLPSEYHMDELMYSSTALGFIFLTLEIVTGSVWAHYAWGLLLELGPERDLVSYYFGWRMP